VEQQHNVSRQVGLPTETENTSGRLELFQGGSIVLAPDSLYINELYNNGTLRVPRYQDSKRAGGMSHRVANSVLSSQARLWQSLANNDAVRTGEGWPSTETRVLLAQ
jgi:hypothetical protein